MSVELVTPTFEQVVEGEDPATPCECPMHDRLPGNQPAEWIVHVKPPPCGCVPKQGLTQFWCDDCLQACLACESGVWCALCMCMYAEPPRRLLLVSYEKIKSAA